jgi:hypothetical protein
VGFIHQIGNGEKISGSSDSDLYSGGAWLLKPLWGANYSIKGFHCFLSPEFYIFFVSFIPEDPFRKV